MIQTRRIRIVKILAILSFPCVIAQSALAKLDDISAIGFRSGFSVGSENEDFLQYEVFLNSKTVWDEISLPHNWKLSTTVTLSGGVLSIGDETELIASLGPRLVLKRVENHLQLEGGISATYLGDKRFGNENFGGQYQFISHFGVNFPLGNQLIINARFQHMSNASLREPNPGLNMFLFGLAYPF